MVSTREFRDVFRVEYQTTGAEKAAADAGKVAASSDAISASVTQQAGKVEGLSKGLAAFARQNDAVFRAQEQVTKAARLLSLAQDNGLQGTLAYTRALSGLAAKEQQLCDITERSARVTRDAANERVKAATDAARKMGSLNYATGSALSPAQIAQARAEMIPLVKVEQEHAAAISKANGNLALGVISQKEHTAAVSQANARLDNQRVAAAKAEEANKRLANGASLNAYAWQNLGFQINDVATSLASGISPMQTLAQQGGQVYQILSSGRGGVGGAIKDIGSALGGLLTPARLAGGALAVIGATAIAAAISWESTETRIRQSLAGMGRGAGATVGDIEQIARQVADASDSTIGSARDLTLELAKTGKVGKDSLGSIAAIGKDFAKTLGIDAKDANELLARSFASPGKGAEDLARNYIDLDDAVVENIKNLELRNEREKAQQALLDALIPRLTKAKELTSGWGSAWDTVKNAASGAYGALEQAVERAQGGQAGRSDAELLADYRRTITVLKTSRSQTSMSTAAIDKQIAAAEAKVAAIEANAQRTVKVAQDVAKTDLSLRAGLLARAGAPETVALDKAIADRKTLNDAISAGAKVSGDSAVALARLDKVIKDNTEAGGALELQEKKRAEASKIAIAAQTAKTPAEVGEIARRKSLNDSLGTAVLRSTALANAERAAAEASSAAQNQIDSETKAIDRSTASSNIVADAWRASGEAAAMRGEAARKAAEDVAKGLPADQAATREQKYLREQLAGLRKERAEQIAQKGVETVVEEKLIKAVDDGKISREQANSQRQRELDIARLTAQAAAAEGEDRVALLRQVDELSAAYEREGNAKADAAAQGLLADQDKQIAMLRLETEMIGESTEARERAVAVLRAQQELQRQGIPLSGDRAQTYINNAALISDLNTAKQSYERLAQDIGQTFTGVFEQLFTQSTATGEEVLKSFASSWARIGSRMVEENIILPMLSGKAGALGSMDFGGLIDTKAIGETMGSALKDVMPDAMSDAMKPLLTPKPGQGMLSSPLFGGLAAGAVGAGIGYSTQSPTMGVLGGGLAGLASGGVAGGLIGAAGGLLGGIFGDDAAKEARQKEIIEAAAEAVKALQQARPQIEMMRATFTGEGVGTLEKQLAEALTQAKAARQTALKAGAKKLAQEIGRDMGEYERRMVAAFKASFDGTVRAMESGEGLDSAFATSAAAATALGEALKGFVGDAERLGKAAVGQARVAAIATALDSLQAPEELSEVQTRLRELEGTGTALRQVLDDLGMSAKKAADAIRDQTKKALDELRDSFAQDLRSKINDAAGKSYLNEVGDLVTERAALLTDAKELGVSGAQVNRYFKLAAQGIVDEADLTGKAFRRLVKQFPELRGSVKAAAKEVEEAVDTIAEKAEAANRIASYRDRVLMAGLDQSTLRGQLAAYNRQALRERQALDDMDATQREMRELEKAQNAERLQIQRDFMKQEREERQEANRQALEDLRAFTRDIKAYLAGLRGGSDSPLSPGDRQTAAQANFNRLLTLAQGGDQDAMGSITGAADLLLQAARDNFASGQGYQDVFAQVTNALEALPSQITANELVVDAIRDMRDVLKTAINASPAATAGALNANFTKLDSTMNGRLSKAELIDGLGPLATKQEQADARVVFNRLDTNGTNQLEKQELVRARIVDARDAVAAAGTSNVAALAVVRDRTSDVVNDPTNGLRAVRVKTDELSNIQIASDGTKTAVGNANATLLEIKALNNTQKSTLQALNRQFAAPQNLSIGTKNLRNSMVVALNKIVYNTAGIWSQIAGGKVPASYAVGGYTGAGGKYEWGGSVHKGEFVLNSEATRRLGVPLLDALNDNRLGAIPGRPVPVAVGGGGVNFAPLVAEIRALRSENREQAELIARIEKQAGDKVASGLEEVEEAVRSGSPGREATRQVVGRGQRIRRRRQA